VILLDIKDILSREDVPTDIKEIIRTISERYQESLDNLRKSEIHYRSLVENSREMIFTTDLEGKITSINSVAVKLTGWSINEWVGKHLNTKVHPDDLDGLFKGFEEVVKGIIPPTPEIRVLTKSGEYRVFEVKANPRIEDGRVVGVLGFAHSRQEFYASEARYRSLIQTMSEGVWVTDLENKTVYVNPALEQMLGYTLGEMSGRLVGEFLTADSLEIFEEKVVERYEKYIRSSTYELCFIRNTQSIFTARVTGTALMDNEGKMIGSFGFLTDISPEKEAQEGYRNLIEFNPDALVLTDLEFNIIQANESAAKLYGANGVDDLIGRNGLEFLAPEDRNFAVATTSETLSERKSRTFEYTMMKMDGVRFPGELIVSVIVDDKDVPTSFISITRDITERKLAEAQLIESERIHRTLVENVNSGIFRVSRQGRLLQANKAFIQMFGYNSLEEISSIVLSDLYVHTQDRKGFVEELYEMGELNIKDVLMKTKDGIHFWASISARVSPNGIWHDGIIEDISKRKYAEEEIKQLKLEEERYSAMLSHFLRNDLQKIVSHLELLVLKNGFEEKLEESKVATIIDIATRSSKTIDKVSLIFEVLQKPNITETLQTESIDLTNLITTLIKNFEYSKRIFEINLPATNIFDDSYLPHAIFELIEFLINSNGDPKHSDIPIYIEGHKFDQYFCLTIRDNYSIPIPEKTCKILASKITERWESHGFYIGVTLASVIMQHLNGQLKIHTAFPRGNEFQLMIPNTLLKEN
jgi:PAS domain S-box-containing protein